MPVIVESWTLYNITLVAHLFLYLAAPILLFKRGWPVAGGLIMLVSTILPIGGQTWFTDLDSPAFGLLLMIELPFAVLVLLIGLAMSVSRFLKKRRLSRMPR